MCRLATITFVTLAVLTSLSPAFGCALCHKCSTEYRCTSTASSAKMQCMATSGGCVAWDSCTSTAGGDGDDCTNGGCTLEIGRAPSKQSSEFRLASVTVKSPHR